MSENLHSYFRFRVFIATLPLGGVAHMNNLKGELAIMDNL